MSKIIKIKMVNPKNLFLDTRFTLIKLVKDITGWSLFDSKIFCDELTSLSEPKYLEIKSEYIGPDGKSADDVLQYFISELKKIDEFYITGGTQWERNIKMLSIGVGDVSDYSDFIKDYICGHSSEAEISSIINLMCQVIDKQYLIDIISNIDKSSKGY
jgi:hypothetical protein